MCVCYINQNYLLVSCKERAKSFLGHMDPCAGAHLCFSSPKPSDTISLHRDSTDTGYSIAMIACLFLLGILTASRHGASEGWPGWVNMGGWLHTEMVYPPAEVAHPSTNRAQHRAAVCLIKTNALPLSQTALSPRILLTCRKMKTCDLVIRRQMWLKAYRSF